MIKVVDTNINEVKLIKPKIFEDKRGYFYESFNQKEFFDKIGKINFIQDNQSKSSYGVLRGLHFQKKPYEQAKLVRVLNGTILDVAVDIRENSKTFLKHVAVKLSDQNNFQLFIPEGFAHGFIVLSKEATIMYKINNIYSPEFDAGYKYDDSSFKIDWLLEKKDIILSEKDSNLPYITNAKYSL